MQNPQSMVHAAADVSVFIPYAVPTSEGEGLVHETFGPNNIRRRTNGRQEMKRMRVRNGRLIANQLSLDSHGFAFVHHSTRVVDFFDTEQLRSIYYPEVEELIKRVAGASRVEVFDHTLRSGDEATREARLIREPVLGAHNDYTEWSGPNRLRELLPDEADVLLAHRFAIIQVWRAINQPIRSKPLAIADAGSIELSDLLKAERRYPHRVGETYALKHNPNHRWFYFPEMRRDEALVFKTYDSEKHGRARFVPHTAFDAPEDASGAPPRESIEVRAFAFF